MTAVIRWKRWPTCDADGALLTPVIGPSSAHHRPIIEPFIIPFQSLVMCWLIQETMSLHHVVDGGVVSAAFIQAWQLLSSRSGLSHIIEPGVCPAATWPFIHVVMSEHHASSFAAPGVLIIQFVHAPSMFASCVAADGGAVVSSALLAIASPTPRPVASMVAAMSASVHGCRRRVPFERVEVMSHVVSAHGARDRVEGPGIG